MAMIWVIILVAIAAVIVGVSAGVTFYAMSKRDFNKVYAGAYEKGFEDMRRETKRNMTDKLVHCPHCKTGLWTWRECPNCNAELGHTIKKHRPVVDCEAPVNRVPNPQLS